MSIGLRRRNKEPRAFMARARRQGVERPFCILVSMPKAVRSHLAALLGLRFRSGHGSPDEQAWRIINTDLRGLQARSHGPREQLMPMSRNHNWWEIILVAARRLGLSIYPGVSEREVERRVFDEIASRVVRGLDLGEVQELDRLACQEPSLTAALSNLGLSRDGLRLVLAGFWRLARVGSSGGHLGPQPDAQDYLAHGMERLGCLHSLSRALRFTMERFGNLLVAWTSMDAFRKAVGQPRTRFVSVLMALYFHNLLEEGLDECELLKA